MPSAYLFPNPRFRAFDADGNILPGAKLQFYESGTTTPVDTYADAALATPNANPVVADSSGEFGVIYLSDAVRYRAILTDANDVEQWDEDPLAPPRDYPAGTIVFFFGDATARDAAYPPALWQVCNGTASSPDLRDKFVIGAGGTYLAGATGGAASVNSGSSGAHDHGGDTDPFTLTTAEMPSHHHRVWSSNAGGTTDAVSLRNPATRTFAGWVVPGTDAYTEDAPTGGDQFIEDTGDGGAHDHGISSDGAHTHTVATVPPFVALWALMRKS